VLPGIVVRHRDGGVQGLILPGLAGLGRLRREARDLDRPVAGGRGRIDARQAHAVAVDQDEAVLAADGDMGPAVFELDQELVREGALDGGHLADPGAGLEGLPHFFDELRVEEGAAGAVDADDFLALTVRPFGRDGRLNRRGRILAALGDEGEDFAVDEHDDEAEADDEEPAEGVVLVAGGESADRSGGLVPIGLAQARNEFPQHSSTLSSG